MCFLEDNTKFFGVHSCVSTLDSKEFLFPLNGEASNICSLNLTLPRVNIHETGDSLTHQTLLTKNGHDQHNGKIGQNRGQLVPRATEM